MIDIRSPLIGLNVLFDFNFTGSSSEILQSLLRTAQAGHPLALPTQALPPLRSCPSTRTRPRPPPLLSVPSPPDVGALEHFSVPTEHIGFEGPAGEALTLVTGGILRPSVDGHLVERM